MSWYQSIALPALRRLPLSLTGQRTVAPDAEASMVFGMRLVLAISALLTLYIGPDGATRLGTWSWSVFVLYALHSVTLLCVARLRAGFWHGPVVYWLDIGWYGLMLLATNGTSGPFFSFFFFAILAASFRHGFDAGARLTLGSAAVVAAMVLVAQGLQHVQFLLLRTTFVLALGYMIAFWGGLAVDQRRRLALLRDVSRLSNPRFGVQHTLDSLMEKILLFYGGTTCVLVMQDAGGRWTLNTVHHPSTGRATSHNSVSDATVQPLLDFDAGATVLYRGVTRRLVPYDIPAAQLITGDSDWRGIDPDRCSGIADLLDTTWFVSAALPLRKGRGRIFVTSNERLRRADATFLNHIVQQAFPVIETIDLLDRLASDAALRERQKIARDLHDSTIQPYIGLRHAVAAIRSQAGDDNAVAPDLDRLLSMCTEVIGDMRHFADRFRNGRQEEPELLIALRRQAAQVRSFYDLDVVLEAQHAPAISDRMAAEVFQIVTEGISNIRKHTRVRTACVRLAKVEGQLAIDIVNGADERAVPAPFMPLSIAERVHALGGTLTVLPTARETLLRIRIPI